MLVELPEPTGVEQHRLLADVLEFEFHLVVLKRGVLRQNFLEQLAKRGDVPFPDAEFVQHAAFRFLGVHLERPVERNVGRLHPQVVVQNEKRLAHRRHDALCVLLGAFEQVHVDQHQDHAVDLVLQRPVGAQAQGVPAPVLAPDVAFLIAERFHHLRQERLQVGEIEGELDGADRPAQVGGDQMEQFFRRRREPPDSHVRPEHDDGHLDAVEQVEEVVVEAVELRVAVVQLVVDGRQLFVAGLDFLLGGFQFFVDALQLFVGRLHLFVGGLQFLVCGLLLLDHRLQVLAGGGQLPRQPGGVGIGRGRFLRRGGAL